MSGGRLVRAQPSVTAGGRLSYLALEPHGTLAFLHEPPAVARGARTAVLMVPPFGWEEVCSSRALRGAAALLARAGYPTARLTLPGTGDGAGGPLEGDLLRHWIDAVGGAAAWIGERTATSRCVVFGIGLGGMLAYLAAREHDAIDDLALWAVPDQGRTLLHEARALSKVIASDFPEDQGQETTAETNLDLIGYLMTGETAAALGGLQLSALALPSSDRRRVLLLSRGAARVDQRLQESLEHQGADVEALRTTDYYSLIVKPEQSRTPETTVAYILDWLARGPVLDPFRTAPKRRRPPHVRDIPQLKITRGVVERAVRCPGGHGDAFGILTRGWSAVPAPFALVLVGAGALPHTGPNRAWVDIARRWAARGIPTVRLDLAGIGEAGGDDPELSSDESTYAPWRVDDVRSVLDQLQALGIADRFVLGGLCSGANCALQGALADPRVCGALLINLFLVTWSSQLIAERSRREPMIDVLPSRPVSPAARRQVTDAIAAFDQLRVRGTQVLLLFGEQEALYQEFAAHGLCEQRGRWPNISLERIPSRDQMFRAQWLQRHVHERVDYALERMLARLTAGVSGAKAVTAGRRMSAPASRCSSPTWNDERSMTDSASPMGEEPNVNEIDERLQNVAREVFGDDSLILTSSTQPHEVPGWDSFGHVNFILSVENEFGLEFSDDEFVHFADIAELKKMLTRKLVPA